MHKHCSNVGKMHPCLATESTNSPCMCTIVTAVLQWQYSQMELIFWVTLVPTSDHTLVLFYVYDKCITYVQILHTFSLSDKPQSFIQSPHS